LVRLVDPRFHARAVEVKSEYVSESRAMEGKFGGCGAAAPRNFF
jgi:hypothetical protein